MEPLQLLQAWHADLHDYHDYQYLTPSSPEMMIIINHNTDIYIEWHNSINGNRMKHQKLTIEGNKSWSRFIITTIMFPFLKRWVTWYLYPWVDLRTITRHPIPWPLSHNFCSSRFLCKLGGTQYLRFSLHSSISVTSSYLCISCTLKSSQTKRKSFLQI